MTPLLYCINFKSAISRYRKIPALQAIAAFIGLNGNDSEQLFSDMLSALKYLGEQYGVVLPEFQQSLNSDEDRNFLTTRPILGFVLTVQHTQSFRLYGHQCLTLLHLINAEFPNNMNNKLSRYSLAARRFFALYDSFCQQNNISHISWEELRTITDSLIRYQPQDRHNIENFISLIDGNWREIKNVHQRRVGATLFEPIRQKINVDEQIIEYVSSTPVADNEEGADALLESYLKTYFREIDSKTPPDINRWKRPYQKAAIAQHQQISPFARDVAQLSELRTLYNAYSETDNEFSKQCIGILIISANTGLTAETIIEAIPWRKKQKDFPIRFQENYSKYTYPLFALGYENKKPDGAIYHKSSRIVTIYLPEGLSRFIQELELDTLKQTPFSSVKQHTAKLISKINKRNNTSLSVARIRNSFISHYVSNWGLDEMYAALISSNYTHRTRTQMNYTRFDPLEIHKRYSNALENANKCYQFFRTYSQSPAGQAFPFGSRAVPMDNAVMTIFEYLRNKITSFGRSMQFTERRKHYNYLTIYTFLVLQLITGHRPVANSSTCRTIFIPAEKIVTVSDKDNISFSEHRTIPLHKGFWQLYERHKTVQKSILNQMSLLYNIPTPTEHCHLLTDSLFLLDDNNQQEWFSKETIQQFLENESINSNFLRHWLRTWLQSEAYSKTLIDHVFGHFTAGTETMSTLSMLNTCDLFDDILKYQGVLLSKFAIKEHDDV